MSNSFTVPDVMMASGFPKSDDERGKPNRVYEVDTELSLRDLPNLRVEYGNTSDTISVVLLTYQRPDELDGALSNLINQDRVPDEIIVIDNDPDGSARQASMINHPTVRYINPGKNLGVTGGRNLGANEAGGDILLFIDDDCRFERYSVTNTVMEIFREKDIGCLAFLVRNAQTREIIAKEFPSYKTDRWSDPHDVTYFLGGACAIRRALFMEVGGYDDILFYGGEELDFSLRIIKKGWRIRYTPGITVLHRVSPKGRGSTRLAFLLIRNRIYLAVKHMPFPFLLTHLAIWGWFAFYQACLMKKPLDHFKGIGAVFKEQLLARAWKYRKEEPMPWNIVQYLMKNGGRLIY